MARATGKALYTLSLFSNPSSVSRLSHAKRFALLKLRKPSRVFVGFRPICALATPTVSESADELKHSMLLERLRTRHLKETAKTQQSTSIRTSERKRKDEFNKSENKQQKKSKSFDSFEELGLTQEVLGAVKEIGIEVPTEIQGIGIPAVLEGKNVVLGSHTGSGKTLAYMLPIVQLLRRDEVMHGMIMKPRRPRAVVLCPTRELSEQVFRVSKSISHHARFRSTMVSGGGRLRPQEDSLSNPIDMVVGTPGRILQHIEEGNMVYGDLKYLVLDEADTMFDRGFGPDIRKFLEPLRHRASKPDGLGFQTVLVTATMTNAVQKLIDEEFQGIVHVRTTSIHKKVETCRHDFIKLSGTENKLEALLQVLEPSLAKGNKVMVFCNTLNSSRAVDHFLGENQIATVNYHGEVPAAERVENLNKFKSDSEGCPTLVCTDLAARGLDLDVDHVIMFDFPKNSIDYLHRTGRTARMGAKGKVTSLIAKKDLLLATRIEEAIRKNESLELLSVDSIKRDIARAHITEHKKERVANFSKQKSKASTVVEKASGGRSKVVASKTSAKPSSSRSNVSASKTSAKSSGGRSKDSASKTSSSKASSVRSKVYASKTSTKAKGGVKSVKTGKPSSSTGSRKPSSVKKQPSKSFALGKLPSSKLSVVGFRGKNSSIKGVSTSN